MKTQVLMLLYAVALVFFAGACRQEADVKSSAAELEKAFQAPAAPGQADPAAAMSAAPADAQNLVQAAVAAVRADDYASGVAALETAQRKPGVSAEQVMAVQRTLQAMTADLVTRAANGDQKALAQLKAIERTRSQ